MKKTGLLNTDYRNVLISINSFTCDIEFLAEAGFALVLDSDPTFIISRVSCSGRAEFIYDWVFRAGKGVDESIIPSDLESVCQVLDVVVADADLAADAHWCPALNSAPGQDHKANGIYNVCCRSKYQRAT